MFTGIITDIGRLKTVRTLNDGRELTVETAYDPETIAVGASIACDGVCLTVTDRGREDDRNWFRVFAARETLDVTTVAVWRQGRRLNLERSLKAGDELGGHIVLGHIDAVATVIAREEVGDQIRFDVRAPAEVMPFVARKGAIALNGTSLTVNEVGTDTFSVHLIPHTVAVTAWGDTRVGDKVNLEVDPLARYAARLIETRDRPGEPGD